MIRKRLKKYIMALLAVMLIFAASGCGSTGEDSSSENTQQKSGGDTITVLNYGE